MTRNLNWPFVGATQLDRSRHVGRGYREALHRLSPMLCAIMDKHAAEQGETWPTQKLDSGEMVFNRAAAAAYAGVDPDTISQWVRRGFINRYEGGQYMRKEIDELRARRAVVARRAADPDTGL